MSYIREHGTGGANSSSSSSSSSSSNNTFVPPNLKKTYVSEQRRRLLHFYLAWLIHPFFDSLGLFIINIFDYLRFSLLL